MRDPHDLDPSATDGIFEELSRLLERDPARGVSTVFEILAGEPRVKPSRGLVIDPGNSARQGWVRRVAAAAALVASPAVGQVSSELVDELAESPDLAADVFALSAPYAALPVEQRAALLAARRT